MKVGEHYNVRVSYLEKTAKGCYTIRLYDDYGNLLDKCGVFGYNEREAKRLFKQMILENAP